MTRDLSDFNRPLKNISGEQINQIFIKLIAIYGSAFYGSIPEEAIPVMKNEWREGLIGFTHNEITSAIKACKEFHSKYAPNFMDFQSLCNGASGIPDSEESFAKAVRRNFTHPIIKLAHEKISSWDWSHGTDRELKPKWARAYMDALFDYRNEKSAQLNISDNSNSDCRTIEAHKAASQPRSVDMLKSIGDIASNVIFDAKAAFKSDVASPMRPASHRLHDDYVETMIAKASDICKLIKKLNPDVGWPDIAPMFARKKQEMRKINPEWKDFELLKILHEELLLEDQENNKGEL